MQLPDSPRSSLEAEAEVLPAPLIFVRNAAKMKYAGELMLTEVSSRTANSRPGEMRLIRHTRFPLGRADHRSSSSARAAGEAQTRAAPAACAPPASEAGRL